MKSQPSLQNPGQGASNSLMKQSKYKIPHPSTAHLDNTMVFKQVSNGKDIPNIQYTEDSDVCGCISSK